MKCLEMSNCCGPKGRQAGNSRKICVQSLDSLVFVGIKTVLAWNLIYHIVTSELFYPISFFILIYKIISGWRLRNITDSKLAQTGGLRRRWLDVLC